MSANKRSELERFETDFRRAKITPLEARLSSIRDRSDRLNVESGAGSHSPGYLTEGEAVLLLFWVLVVGIPGSVVLLWVIVVDSNLASGHLVRELLGLLFKIEPGGRRVSLISLLFFTIGLVMALPLSFLSLRAQQLGSALRWGTTGCVAATLGIAFFGAIPDSPIIFAAIEMAWIVGAVFAPVYFNCKLTHELSPMRQGLAGVQQGAWKIFRSEYRDALFLATASVVLFACFLVQSRELRVVGISLLIVLNFYALAIVLPGAVMGFSRGVLYLRKAWLHLEEGRLQVRIGELEDYLLQHRQTTLHSIDQDERVERERLRAKEAEEARVRFQQEAVAQAMARGQAIRKRYEDYIQ